MKASVIGWSVGLVVALAGAPAAAEDGVWIGREVGGDEGVVVLQRRGESLLLSDAKGIWFGRVSVTIGGPGTKGGEIQLDVDLTTGAAATASGAGLPGLARGSKRLAKWRENPDTGVVRFCVNLPKTKLVRPASATEPSKTSRCYTLERVPAPPVEAPPAPEPSFECMRECRQANMMRAVSPEVIDEDCKRTCTPK